jgi:hypothetical protein
MGNFDLQNFDVFGNFEQAFQKTDVSIVEFAESDEFCGKPLYPRQRVLLKLIWLEEMDGYEEDVLSEWIRGDDPDVQICSKIRERRDRLRDEGYKHFREIMLIGGRRSSKGHVTGLSIAKKAYDTILLGNPQQHFGIDHDKQIYFTIIASALDQAKQYQFADAVGSILACRALEPYVDRVLEEVFSLYTPHDLEKVKRFAKGKAKIERNFASILGKPRAANASSIRGEATIVAVFDEMAFMLEGVNSKSSAEKMYKAVTPALDQFKKDAMIFQNSSPWTEVGQFYENYRKFMPLGKDGTLDPDNVIDYRSLAFRFPSWELYKDWERDKRWKTALVLPPEQSDEMRLEEEKDPETFRVERRSHFAKVTDSFLNADKVDEMFEPWEGKVLLTKFNRSGFGPEVKFKGHADPSTTTANFGLAIAHREYGKDRDGNDVPHVIFDYIHAWIPSHYEDNTINYLEVEDDIVSLITAFRPDEFSFDQFNSRLLIDSIRQKVQAKRVVGTRVVEKTATATQNYNKAHMFKTALNLNLVHAPADSPGSEILRNEMKFLQESAGRVDKQKTGPVTTKDVFDCAAECVYYLLNDYLSQDISELAPAIGLGVGGPPSISRGLSSPAEFYKTRNSLSGGAKKGGRPFSPARGALGRRGRRFY